MASVKGSTRTEKARETRRRMLAAAEELFVRGGYGNTAIQGIADRAGVAVQTIYFTFGTKRALLKELADVTVAGDDEPLATMERPWFTDAVAAATADGVLAAYAEGACAVLARIASITDVIRAAATQDTEIAALWKESLSQRRTVQERAATALVARPGARPGLAIVDVADVLYGVFSPELYLLMVRDCGWEPARFHVWTLRTLRDQLIEPS